jgi:hypothetical protein
MFRKVRRFPVRPLRLFSHVNSKDVKTFSAKNEADISALHLSLRTCLISLIKSHIKQIVPQLTNYRTSYREKNILFDSYIQAYLSEKMDHVSEKLISWLESMKDIQLHEHIIQGWINILEEHVKRYKSFRNEIESDILIKNGNESDILIKNGNEIESDSIPINNGNEIESDIPIKNARKPIHLDDFNEYTYGLYFLFLF